jgi:predicted nucleic acid-binding Zn ribbon protein
MRDNPKTHRMTKGQWAVHRERGRIQDYFQPPRRTDGKAVKSGVSSLMKGIGLDEEHWIATLSSEWQQIVGSGVGRHTKPGRISGTTLYVFVDSSVWLNELKRYGQKEMLHNLQLRFGTNRIRNLSIQLDPDKGV